MSCAARKIYRHLTHHSQCQHRQRALVQPRRRSRHVWEPVSNRRLRPLSDLCSVRAAFEPSAEALRTPVALDCFHHDFLGSHRYVLGLDTELCWITGV